ncbi:MAG: class I SAM-dependent methyltransferase [Gemmatimonadaceae bacterium]|nr:class I SAM-dependent methyltransferase [Gemmatimonadaceae bacterium]
MCDEQATTPGSGDASEVARAYDAWAEQYDHDRNATRDLDGVALRRAPIRLRGRAVVEVGCGTGKNTVWLAGEAESVLAMDLSSGMLARARARVGATNVRFVAHDARERWPLESGSVDVVTCNLVLEHVRELAPVFHEAARVLRSGGELFVSELHPARQLRGGQAHYTNRATGALTKVPAHVHSVEEFIAAGVAAGLRLCELGESTEACARAGAPPRLLTLLFDRA